MITRLHRHTDAPVADFTRIDENIPMISLEKLHESLIRTHSRSSKDVHSASPIMLKSLHESHRTFFLSLYNRTFSEYFHPTEWKVTRVILVARNTFICEPSNTCPIPLLDTL
jgi:hypothetical protein